MNIEALKNAILNNVIEFEYFCDIFSDNELNVIDNIRTKYEDVFSDLGAQEEYDDYDVTIQDLININNDIIVDFKQFANTFGYKVAFSNTENNYGSLIVVLTNNTDVYYAIICEPLVDGYYKGINIHAYGDLNTCNIQGQPRLVNVIENLYV